MSMIIDGEKLNLSPAEQKIAEYIIKGFTAKQIGKILERSHRTIEIHRRSIIEKSGCKNCVDLAYKVGFSDGISSKKMVPSSSTN